MKEMYSDSSLAALVAVASMEVDSLRFQLGRDHLFQLNDTHRALDKLSFSYGVHGYPDYRSLILEFLEDHSRSGIYALNGQRYATAAVYFLKRIQKEQITPSNPPTTQDKTQANHGIPWLWLGLKCLVHVLPRSDSSEELTALVHQLKLGPLSGEDDCQKIAVHQEIARYLARIE